MDDSWSVGGATCGSGDSCDEAMARVGVGLGCAVLITAAQWNSTGACDFQSDVDDDAKVRGLFSCY